MTNILFVRTPAQREIFMHEIRGQISDGIWENEKTDKRLWNCEVYTAMDGEKLGCNFKVKYPIDLCHEFFFDFLAERTINYAKKVNPDYNIDMLIVDLNDLTKIIFNLESWQID